MRVRWLPKALAERNEQLDYIAKDNTRAAIDQGDRIQRAADKLADFPEAGRLGRKPRTRELVVPGTPFLLVYRIRPDRKEVQVLRLIHGARRWPPRPKWR